MRSVTTKDIVTEIGISEGSVRNWVRDLEIPHEIKKGKRVFSSDALEIFKTIKELKSKDCGNDTIRRAIPQLTIRNQKDHRRNESEITHNESVSKTIEEVVKEAVKNTIAENYELSERYAKISFEYGKLTNENETLKLQLLSASEQLQERPGSDYLDAILAKNKELEEELELVRAQKLRVETHISHHWLGKLLFKKLF